MINYANGHYYSTALHLFWQTLKLICEIMQKSTNVTPLKSDHKFLLSGHTKKTDDMPHCKTKTDTIITQGDKKLCVCSDINGPYYVQIGFYKT